MAALAQTTGVFTSDRDVTLTRLALGASDTLTWQDGGGQYLILFNTTASPVVVTLVGTAPTTISPPGYGGDISTSAGKAITVPANGAKMVNLDDIRAFLTGTGVVTMTGGTGVTAMLVAS